jgi:predicted GNAT family acetyltransferase
MESGISIINNEKRSRFETLVDGEYAYLSYQSYHGKFALMYVFVPEPARGKGISSVLIKYVLDYAREKNLKLIVFCSYIAKYIRLHPEYESLLVEAEE